MPKGMPKIQLRLIRSSHCLTLCLSGAIACEHPGRQRLVKQSAMDGLLHSMFAAILAVPVRRPGSQLIPIEAWLSASD